ncbi:hypothetical protein KIS4809_2986 [Bacillus sp. ZZV12-4809]|nr:hypothetical protein KIS4809_2986 [Bacillus sp. ZZV12-4809]
MRSRRRVNKYPYIILGSIHLVMLVITLVKSRNRKRDMVLFLNYAGMAYIFEYIVVALFDGYVYKPKFIKQRNLDNIFGAIWSQFFYVPVTALFITVLNLGWRVKVLFSLYFVLIEKLFIFLGVFKNKWWKTRYTFCFILISFYCNDYWHEQLKKKRPLIMFISLFNIIQVTWMNTVYLFALLRKVRYGFPEFLSWKEHFIVGPFFGFLLSLATAFWTKKATFTSLFLNFLTMSMVDLFLIRKHLEKIKNPLNLPLIYSIIIMASHFYRKLIYKQLENE